MKIIAVIFLFLLQTDGFIQIARLRHINNMDSSLFDLRIIQLDSLNPKVIFSVVNNSIDTILVPSMFNSKSKVNYLLRDLYFTAIHGLGLKENDFDTILPYRSRDFNWGIADHDMDYRKYNNLFLYRDRLDLPIKLQWRIGDNAFSNVYYINWVSYGKVQLIDSHRKPDYHIEGIIKGNIGGGYKINMLTNNYMFHFFNNTDYDYFLIPELWSENNCPKIFDLETGETFLWTDSLKQTEPVKLFKNKQNSLDFEFDIQSVFIAYPLDRDKEYGLIWQINNYYFTDMLKFSYKPKE